MNLTDDERRRFVIYCRHEAASIRGIAEQMQKINVPEFIISHRLTEASAFEIVARILDTTETQEPAK